MLTNISSWIINSARTIPYKDLIEIFFFSTVIYYLLLWLRKDTQKNLIGYFYAYCFIFFTAHYANLPVIRFALFITAPIVALIFIIMHQETLQKNFVTLTKRAPELLGESHWVDELIKCCLMALNRHREIILVIERNDQLKSLIHAPYFIYAELKKDVFDILLEKHIADNDYMMWINQQGKLVAINCTWRTHLDETWISKDAQNMHQWQQSALFITSRTDALMLKVNPLTRSFDLVLGGKILEGMSAEQTSGYMKKNLAVVKVKAAAHFDKQPPSEKTL